MPTHDGINLAKSYSALNEKLIKLFDESGVKRSFTVPYIDGQETADHVHAVGQAASEAGGLAKTLVMTSHHASGKGWGTGDGHTTGHSSDKLRSTIIPEHDAKAKAVIAAAQKMLNDIGRSVGENDPSVKTSLGQLDLVKKTDGAGMNLLDFGVMMIQLMVKPMQSAARSHASEKHGGLSTKLTPPTQAGGADGGQPPDSAQPSQAPAAGAPEAPASQSEAAPAPAAAPASEAAVAAPQA